MAVFFPPECVLCGRPLDDVGPVCAHCAPDISDTVEPRCRVCGDQLTEDADLCLACATRDRGFSRVISLGAYGEVWGDLVSALKFDRERAVARYLGARVADHLRDLGLAGSFDRVTFVPMTRQEFRRRGFNPARDLAASVAKRLCLPLCTSLQKTRSTAPQRTLTAAARRENLRGAFRGLRSRGRRVLLVDDICTTGWTLERCAEALRQDGATEVVGVTVARA